jgi:hypothetical protein
LNLLEAKKDAHENHVTMPQDGLVRWISKMSRPTELPPYHAGAVRSPLMRLLESEHYEVKLTAEERHKFAAWIDLLVPFCGDYREGHAWSDRELDFYGYYETKRDWQKQEEERETRAHQAHRGGLPMPPRESTEASLQAAFRKVLAAEPLARRDDGAHSLTSHQPVIIDRLWLHARSATTNDPIHLEIHDEKDKRVLASAKVSPGPPGTFILLSEPLRSDRLVITTRTTDASVTLQRAFGVRVDEVPVVDGFHPFLEKHLAR